MGPGVYSTVANSRKSAIAIKPNILERVSVDFSKAVVLIKELLVEPLYGRNYSIPNGSSNCDCKEEMIALLSTDTLLLAKLSVGATLKKHEFSSAIRTGISCVEA